MVRKLWLNKVILVDCSIYDDSCEVILLVILIQRKSLIMWKNVFDNITLFCSKVKFIKVYWEKSYFKDHWNAFLT